MNIPIIVMVSIAIIVCIGFWYVWWNQHKLVNDLQQIKLNLQLLQTTDTQENKQNLCVRGNSLQSSPLHPNEVAKELSPQNTVINYQPESNTTYQNENNNAEASSESEDDSSSDDSYSDDDDDLSSQNEVETSEYKKQQENVSTSEGVSTSEINTEQLDIVKPEIPLESSSDNINIQVNEYMNDASIKMVQDISLTSSELVDKEIISNIDNISENVDSIKIENIDLNASVIETENFVENQGDPEKMRVSLKQKTVSELKKLCEKSSVNVKKPGGYKTKKELIDGIVEKYS
jgi:hypothetical protein